MPDGDPAEETTADRNRDAVATPHAAGSLDTTARRLRQPPPAGTFEPDGLGA
ncbi:MAG TPA: hypothetical protein VGP69_02225 [Gaiellaceae bacterium]|jgi:hypothetical protein|nr:hypothetical protein [Gaiellaceae bacterium]